MEMDIRLFFVIFMALNAHQSSAFLLSSECPAPSPCTCLIGNTIYIYCYARSFKSIPQIAQYNTTVDSLQIQLYSNSLTSIPNNAIKNLSSINASNIEFQLNNNNINMIGNDAFKGVENTTRLYLYSNNLTAIPFAISKLTHLKYFSIAQNPLRTIDPSVMPNIGGSLKTFNLDVGGFSEWPTDFHYLRTLQSFTVDYIPFTHLDINAFRGFENTLEYLHINHAKLEKVPHAICRLTNLTQLVFSYNQNLKENRSSIFEPCGHKLPTVTSISIDNNNLHNFPDIFSLFPSLEYLSATDNKFQYIDNSLIPTDGHLFTIELTRNLFERIPSALNKLVSLHNIAIEYNKIRTVESADLYGLPNLTTLSLKNNPLSYIDLSAFSHNYLLASLELQNTQIDHVPQAVICLYYLRNLILDAIDCTCEMSYLKHWNVLAVTEFSTQCAYSTETIKTFVMTSLQSCPNA